jgi:hypothetical protein
LKECGTLSGTLLEIHAETVILEEFVVGKLYDSDMEEMAATEPVRPISDWVAQCEGTLRLDESLSGMVTGTSDVSLTLATEKPGFE